MLRRLLSGLGRLFSPLGPGDFIIQYRPNHPISVRGTIAKGKVAGIAGFFDHDLRLSGTVTIRGTKGRGPMRLDISGYLNKVEAQRVRNFLMEHLR